MSEVSDDAKIARRGEGVRAGVSRPRTPVGVEGERRVGERESWGGGRGEEGRWSVGQPGFSQPNATLLMVRDAAGTQRTPSNLTKNMRGKGVRPTLGWRPGNGGWRGEAPDPLPEPAHLKFWWAWTLV